MAALRNQKGITIVEIMVAAVILVFTAVALLGLYNSNFSWIVRAGYRTVALDEAKASLDSVISAGATNSSSMTIAFGGSVPSVTVPGQFITATGAGGPGDSITVTLNSFIPYIAP